MTDKITGYMHLHVLMYRFNKHTWRVDSQDWVTMNPCICFANNTYVSGTCLYKIMDGNYFPAAEYFLKTFTA